MAGLSEENQNLIAENKELREKLAQAEGLDDLRYKRFCKSTRLL